MTPARTPAERTAVESFLMAGRFEIFISHFTPERNIETSRKYFRPFCEMHFLTSGFSVHLTLKVSRRAKDNTKPS